MSSSESSKRSPRSGPARHPSHITPLLLTSQRTLAYSYGVAKGKGGAPKADVLQGTLDLMILKTLDSMGPLHGYGIARRLEQISEDVLKLNEGTVYASLMRLQHEGWITATWGASENNRRAKFYSLTRAGRRQLVAETEQWERMAGVIGRVLRPSTES
jgi:PadR family transcriptional regulator PadR